MNCMYCSGNMERGIAPFHTDRKGYHITLDRIPAWVCGQCGEEGLSDDKGRSLITHLSMTNAKQILANGLTDLIESALDLWPDYGRISKCRNRPYYFYCFVTIIFAYCYS